MISIRNHVLFVAKTLNPLSPSSQCISPLKVFFGAFADLNTISPEFCRFVSPFAPFRLSPAPSSSFFICPPPSINLKMLPYRSAGRGSPFGSPNATTPPAAARRVLELMAHPARQSMPRLHPEPRKPYARRDFPWRPATPLFESKEDPSEQEEWINEPEEEEDPSEAENWEADQEPEIEEPKQHNDDVEDSLG